jgi:hypothetical protein
MEATNRAVLDTIAHDVLAPAVVEETLAVAIREIRDAETIIPAERRTLEAELGASRGRTRPSRRRHRRRRPPRATA